MKAICQTWSNIAWSSLSLSTAWKSGESCELSHYDLVLLVIMVNFTQKKEAFVQD